MWIVIIMNIIIIIIIIVSIIIISSSSSILRTRPSTGIETFRICSARDAVPLRDTSQLQGAPGAKHHRRNRNPRPQPQTFSKLVFLMYFT